MNAGINGAVAGAIEANRPTDRGILNACHQCRSGNRDDAKFCYSCGAPLFQACPSCEASTRIGQTFCSGCGFNIAASFQQKLVEAESKLAEANQAIENLDFDQAGEILRWIKSHADARTMADVISKADSAFVDLTDCRNQWNDKLQSLTSKAVSAAQQLDHSTVVSTVDMIPERLLSDELKKLRQRSQQSLDDQQDLRQSLKSAIKQKDYINVGYLVESLLAIKPNDSELLSLSSQINGVLLKSAASCLSENRYAEGFASLAAIPSSHRDSDEYHKLKSSIDDAVWITDQIARSPFATRQLGLLAKRLGTMAPTDGRVAKVVQEIAGKLKAGTDDPLSLNPRWMGPSKGWGDASVTVAGTTKRIVWGSQPDLVRNPTRYMVAIGLALHGIGESKFDGYAVQTKGLTSLITRFSKKLPPAAWGIDLGASAVRAVKLERQGDRYKIADVIWLPFESLKGRSRGAEASDLGAENQPAGDQFAELSELAGRIGTDPIPVWANVPSSDALGRFFSMPPLPEKKLAALLEVEISVQFPLPADQLSVASGVTGTDVKGSPRGTIVACKKTNVEKREKAFLDSGIKLSGLMPDPVALHQYASYEWGHLIACDETAKKAKAIAVLDSGATGSTLYVGSAAGFWFRHHGFGGDDLTTVVAGMCNLTHQQADAARIELYKIVPLAQTMEALERRMETFAFRLSQSALSAFQTFENVELTHVFCTGGTAMHHGWTRHTLSAQLPST